MQEYGSAQTFPISQKTTDSPLRSGSQCLAIAAPSPHQASSYRSGGIRLPNLSNSGSLSMHRRFEELRAFLT
jgi:hypothetical protein